jgi:hypothetical protein
MIKGADIRTHATNDQQSNAPQLGARVNIKEEGTNKLAAIISLFYEFTAHLLWTNSTIEENEYVPSNKLPP